MLADTLQRRRQPDARPLHGFAIGSFALGVDFDNALRRGDRVVVTP
jgi:hypothetical protein